MHDSRCWLGWFLIVLHTQLNFGYGYSFNLLRKTCINSFLLWLYRCEKPLVFLLFALLFPSLPSAFLSPLQRYHSLAIQIIQTPLLYFANKGLFLPKRLKERITRKGNLLFLTLVSASVSTSSKRCTLNYKRRDISKRNIFQKLISASSFCTYLLVSLLSLIYILANWRKELIKRILFSCTMLHAGIRLYIKYKQHNSFQSLREHPLKDGHNLQTINYFKISNR